MKNIYCLNNISQIGLNTLSSQYHVVDQIEGAHALLVRSASLHDMTLPHSVLAVARAGAGVNNIPFDTLAKSGVVVMNTPGANANAVKELTLAGMFLASRDIYGGMSWIKENKNDPDLGKTVEKVKAKFGGTEITGKTIGIIGLGAIGLMLAHACHALGMKVVGTKRHLESLRSEHLPNDMILVKTKEELYPLCDFISLNLPLTPDTKQFINENALSQMKDGVIILNFARDLLVNDNDLEKAISSGKVRSYVTDFPNTKTAQMEGVIAIPHLGASTEEAEDNCASMAVKQVMNYIDHGIILNSVNYPDLNVEPKKSKVRLGILYENHSSLQEQFLHIIEKHVKLTHSYHAKNETYGYSLFDFDDQQTKLLELELSKAPGFIKTRIII